MSQNRLVLATAQGNFSAIEVVAADSAQAPVVIVAHGFPDDHANLAPLAAALARRGYRAIVPVMRGYERSTQRPGPIYPSQLADDVFAWMDALEVDRAHLVGHDWGAVAAYAAARHTPERLASVTTLAVPPLQRWGRRLLGRPKQLTNSWYMAFFQLPALPERTLRGGLVEILWQAWSPHWRPSPLALSRAVDRLSQPGVTEHALAYYRALPRWFTAEGKRSLRLLGGRVKTPTMALYGVQDGCLDARLFDLAAVDTLYPEGLVMTPIQDAGHWLHLEQPDAVSTAIGDWLDAHQA